VNDDFKPTSESLEVKLFTEEEIPWDDLAFPFVPTVLKNYFKDKEKGEFPLRTQTIERPVKPIS
jgi:hypothetical protein